MDVQKIWAELSAKAQEASKEIELSAEEVKLAAMQDADEIHRKLVKGAQRQASILNKVENDLKSLAGEAEILRTMEQRLQSMAKELGVDLDVDYASDAWANALSRYANEVGVIANKL